MSKLKNFIIYGAIILLCIAAFGGYLISKKTSQTTGNIDTNRAEVNTTTSTETSSDTESAASNSEMTPLGKIMITDGNNITGKSEEEKQSHIRKVMERELEKLDPNPTVGVGRGKDFSQVTAEAVENAGGLKGIIKKGDVVLIKPNLCSLMESDGSPMTTDYRIVQEVIDIANQCQASKVIVAEGNFSSNAFENITNKYVDLKGAKLFNFNDCEEKDCYKLTPHKSLVGKELFIPKIYMDADVVVNVAKLKTHFLTTVTLGLKNSIGVPSYKLYTGSGSKTGLHNLGIEEVIIDLNKIRKPDFTIIDGIIGGENYGPTSNTPVESNVVFAGKDVVAVDTVALTFMGFKLDDISHVKLAAKETLGIADLNKIKVKGADLKSIIMHFTPALPY